MYCPTTSISRDRDLVVSFVTKVLSTSFCRYQIHYKPTQMPEAEIRFASKQVPPGSFRLLELPPDLCKLIESSVDELKFVLTRPMLLAHP